jgi:hypothetical protein
MEMIICRNEINLVQDRIIISEQINSHMEDVKNHDGMSIEFFTVEMIGGDIYINYGDESIKKDGMPLYKINKDVFIAIERGKWKVLQNTDAVFTRIENENGLNYRYIVDSGNMFVTIYNVWNDRVLLDENSSLMCFIDDDLSKAYKWSEFCAIFEETFGENFIDILELFYC